MKFGPDVGQLQKGDVDPVAVVKNFLPVVQHMHFKDWVGGPSMAVYFALGLGKVDLVGILDIMCRTPAGLMMVERDSGGRMPYTARGARGRWSSVSACLPRAPSPARPAPPHRSARRWETSPAPISARARCRTS